MNPLLVSDNRTVKPIRKVSKPRRYTPENGYNKFPPIDILRLEMNMNNVVNPTRAILDRFIPVRALPMQKAKRDSPIIPIIPGPPREYPTL